MDLETAAAFFNGSLFYMMGFIVIFAGAIVINNLLHKYWKPVRFFTTDSWAMFAHHPRYATEEELTRITPHLDESKKTK